MRLGEILLRHGLITADELGEGLATQVTHGGRIGSNLIDLGYIAVDDVARALGKQHGVPAARDEAFRAVTSATLGAVPKDLCAKHGIFPLAVDGAVLHLAMRNPQHLALIDQLGRVLNLTIQPYATAELRLLYFLELLYAIPRPKRYLATQGDGGWRGEHDVTVSKPPHRAAQRGLDQSQTAAAKVKDTPAAGAAQATADRTADFPDPATTRVPTLTPPALPAVRATKAGIPATTARETADPEHPSASTSFSGTDPQSTAPALPRSSHDEFELVYLDEVDHSKHHGDDDAFDLDIDVSFDEDSLGSDSHDAASHDSSADEGSQPDITHHGDAALTPTPTATVAELITALESARDREAVIAQLLRPLRNGVSLTVLLLPRGDLAVGLAATGATISRGQVRQLVVPMNTDSLFAQAIADLRPARGPADALQHMIATYLRAPRPDEACVTPIRLHGKVINLLCTQSQSPLPEGIEDDLAQVAHEAAITYKRLILKKHGDQAP